ncbi:amidoligase family protein [Myxococcota bacterium]|nr:amidoligase family protein [Myxococcota bacterium]
MAPPGASRETLASALAAGIGGQSRPGLHPQSEPSRVPGQPVFYNLTPSFEVLNAAGERWALCVDDLTLQDDLNKQAAPLPGWWRVVSDDPRLLRLVARHAHPRGPLYDALAPVAALFGAELLPGEGGMWKVVDETGASVALGAPLPGERERPCELITAPISADHHAALEARLAPARALGFFAPVEGATHLHFDAGPLRSARAVQNLVRLFVTFGPTLRAQLGVNPRCRRLGPLQPELIAAAESPGFLSLPWEEAQARLAQARPDKYRDLNLRNLIYGLPHKHTVELRILPVHTYAGPIVEAAALGEALLRRAIAEVPVERRAPLRPGLEADSALRAALSAAE